MVTVAVITGTRAEYGLLRPVLRLMAKSEVLRPALLVTGSHLSVEYGHTIDDIMLDGFPVAAELDILSQSAPPGRAGTARRTALALGMFLQYFEQNRPAALLALGDRYETLAAAEAAALLAIPVAHISGGDVTAGADDDWFRHCITKMARLHFPSCETYRQRVIRMGEAPDTVFNVGGLGDENVRSMDLLSREALARQADSRLTKPYALVTLHPETAPGSPPPEAEAQILLNALSDFPDLFYLFTGANSDAGGDVINRMFEAYCRKASNAVFFASLGTLRYLSAMKYAELVIGNSSSGVAEAPSLGVPVVDIGERQRGRVMAGNILHCEMEKAAIAQAIRKARNAEFIAAARKVKSPYNGGATSKNIVEILEAAIMENRLEKPKIFYDGGGET